MCGVFCRQGSRWSILVTVHNWNHSVGVTDVRVVCFADKVAGGASGQGQPQGSMGFFLPPYGAYPNGVRR